MIDPPQLLCATGGLSASVWIARTLAASCQWHKALALIFLVCSSLLAQQDPLIQRIAFGSCASQDFPQAVWDPINDAKPDLFIFLGDNVYADGTDMDYIRKCYQKLAAIPGFKKLRESNTRILATWDDHDMGQNDGGNDYPKRAESQQVFLEFFNEPKDSPRWKRQGVYQSYLFGPLGKRVQIILLDTRYHRTPLKLMDPLYKEYDPKSPHADKDGFVLRSTGRHVPDYDPKATILGDQQWQWLEEQLKVPADLRIIGSSVQFVADDQPWEKWGNFPLEQQRFYKLVKETKASGIFFISGDRHRAEISRIDKQLPYPLYDITSSSLNSPSKPETQDEPNRYRVGRHNFVDSNFGLLKIDWSAADPKFTMEICDTQGKVVLSQALHLSSLRFAK
jgi:alkaline phosphatase D